MPSEPTLVVLRYSPWSEWARWALDRVGASERLIPEDLEGEIRRLTELADRAMDKARGLVVAGLLSWPVNSTISSGGAIGCTPRGDLRVRSQMKSSSQGPECPTPTRRTPSVPTAIDSRAQDG